MSKNTVVVTNRSGARLSILGRRIMSLRETIKDQEFPFEQANDAMKFADLVNGQQQRGLTAIYAGPEINTASVDTTAVDTATSAFTQEELKAKTVVDLKTICKERKIKGYSGLNEDALIKLILTAQQ